MSTSRLLTEPLLVYMQEMIITDQTKKGYRNEIDRYKIYSPYDKYTYYLCKMTPDEFSRKVQTLIDQLNSSSKSDTDIIVFSKNLLDLHPFKDGNG